MKLSDFKALNMPETPGVYLFTGKGGDGRENILYIGKAASLHDRVKSYFSDDILSARGLHIGNMVTLAETVKWKEADSALEALLLENRLIKAHQPHYNTREKDDKSYNCVIVTKEEFPRVLVVRRRDLEKKEEYRKVKYSFGPFPEGMLLREAMKIVRKIFPYRDSSCLPAQAGTPRQGRPCFNRQLGLCPGVCDGTVDKKEYGKTIQRIKLFFEGKKSSLVKNIEREMKRYAKAEEFEKASEMKRTLFALTHIKDVALIKDMKREPLSDKVPFRIEAYDVAHLAGASRVGVMTVVENDMPEKGEYRRFKLEKGLIDDIAGLKELLRRRLNHPEWRLPDLIVVDGGIAQKNAAEKMLAEHGLSIPVAAVVKNERHRPERLLGERAVVDNRERPILLANSEAHRFAVSYHRHKERGRIKARNYKTS
ncbi:MAG: GIY-YIG nuclease family protein [bacterium]|nr:GIY-YIG nuclease family protein [bacterium]